MKYAIFLLALLVSIQLNAADKKPKKQAPKLLTPTSFNGVTVGMGKGAIQAKGYRCQDLRIGDYLTLHECRHDIEFAGEQVQAYATLNDAGTASVASGFDVFYPGDSLGYAQKKFYDLVTVVQAMLGAQPADIKTPDSYIALTKFVFPKTSVSCYLYSDDRVKPPRLRCGCEVTSHK